MKTLFILSLFRQGDKIKISTLYHLLKGKRTISVLMSAFLHGNLPVFQLFPGVTEKEYQECLDALIFAGFLVLDEEGEWGQITRKGQEYLTAQRAPDDPSSRWLDNYRYGKTDKEMWRQIQFLVQVVSQLSYRNASYVPLESSPLYQWRIKQLLKQVGKEGLGQRLRDELQSVLGHLSDQESQFLGQQLSGYQWNGKTEQQLIQQLPQFSSVLVLKSCYHHFFKVIEDSAAPLLSTIVSQELHRSNNRSMLQTKKLWLSGMPPERIAEVRKMRRNTVNDHLLELAIQEKEHPCDGLLAQEQLDYLKQLRTPPQEWQYRQLKERLPTLDYFNFRLAQILTIHNECE